MRRSQHFLTFYRWPLLRNKSNNGNIGRILQAGTLVEISHRIINWSERISQKKCAYLGNVWKVLNSMVYVQGLVN